MITISKNKMKELLIKLMDLGLTNKEIAVRLNDEYGATEDNQLSTQQVAKYKALVGLKGYKPKKKQLFELVDDETEVLADGSEITSPEFEDDGEFDDTDAERLLHEKDLEDEFLTNPEARYNMELGSETSENN